MTRSLIIAQQCTVDTLQSLEEEEVQQQSSGDDTLSPPLTSETPPLGRVLRIQARHRYSRSFDNPNFPPPSPAKNLERKRASVWINDLIFDKSPLPPGFRRQTWGDAECALFLDQQPHYFLQKWTDQGERLNDLRREYVQQSPRQQTSADVVETDMARQISQDTSSNNSDVTVSRQANSLTSYSGMKYTPFVHTPLTFWLDFDVVTAGNKPGGVEIFKGFRFSMEDPCYKILPAALLKYNITAPWENYALYIVYGNKERCLGMEEKPLMIFKALDKEGLKPMFMLRKIFPSENLLAYEATKSAGLDRRSRRDLQATYNLPGGII